MRMNVRTALLTTVSVGILAALFAYSPAGESAVVKELTRSDMAGLRGGGNSRKCVIPNVCSTCVATAGCGSGNASTCSAMLPVVCPGDPHKDCTDGATFDFCTIYDNDDGHHCKTVLGCVWVPLPPPMNMMGMCLESGSSASSDAYSACQTQP